MFVSRDRESGVSQGSCHDDATIIAVKKRCFNGVSCKKPSQKASKRRPRSMTARSRSRQRWQGSQKGRLDRPGKSDSFGHRSSSEMIASRCRPEGGFASGGGFFQCASSEMSFERYAKVSSIRVRS